MSVTRNEVKVLTRSDPHESATDCCTQPRQMRHCYPTGNYEPCACVRVKRWPAYVTCTCVCLCSDDIDDACFVLCLDVRSELKVRYNEYARRLCKD
jgi:hypothetical protein